MRRTVLVTRPQPDCDQLVEMLHKEGYHALACPLFETVYQTIAPPNDAIYGVIATSRNALKAVARFEHTHLLSFPFFAVGTETADAARELGFHKIHVADGNSDALASMMIAAQPNAPLLYLAGEKRKEDLEKQLADAGLICHVWEGYDMQALPDFDPNSRSALEQRGVAAVLLFSERAARRFLTLIAPMGQIITNTPDYLCLSPAIAAPLQERGLRAFAAKEATVKALLHLLEQKNIR